jgi:hypothetical protein
LGFFDGRVGQSNEYISEFTSFTTIDFDRYDFGLNSNKGD